ncbi:MAG: hypothetical protein NVSMB21_11490 [Vulcanimicrobiaceae bacterium]
MRDVERHERVRIDECVARAVAREREFVDEDRDVERDERVDGERRDRVATGIAKRYQTDLRIRIARPGRCAVARA